MGEWHKLGKVGKEKSEPSPISSSLPASSSLKKNLMKSSTSVKSSSYTGSGGYHPFLSINEKEPEYESVADMIQKQQESLDANWITPYLGRAGRTHSSSSSSSPPKKENPVQQQQPVQHIDELFEFGAKMTTTGKAQQKASSIDNLFEFGEQSTKVSKPEKGEKKYAVLDSLKEFALRAFRYATLGGVSYQTRLNLQDYFGKEKFNVNTAYIVSTFTTGAVMAYAGAAATEWYVSTFGPLFYGPWSAAGTGAVMGAAYNIAETVYALRSRESNPPLRTILHYPIEFFAKKYLDAHGYDRRVEGKFLENPAIVVKKAFSLSEKHHEGGD